MKHSAGIYHNSNLSAFIPREKFTAVLNQISLKKNQLDRTF